MARKQQRQSKPAPPTPTSAVSLPTAVLLVALVVIPAYFNIQSGASFEPDKDALLRTLTLVAALSLGTGWVQRWSEGWRPSLRQASLPILLLGAGVVWAIVATLFSADPTTSFWGSYERGFGLLSVFAGVVVIALAVHAARKDAIWLVVDAALLGAAIPALYGLAQVLGYDPVQGSTISFAAGQRAASTLGNPLFLGEFLLLALTLAVARRWVGPKQKAWARWLTVGYSALLLIVLLATGSRSALFGLMATASVLLVARGKQTGQKSLALAGLAPLAAVAALILLAWLAPAVLPLRLADLVASGGSGGQRLLIWQGVLDMLRAHPRTLLAGVGLDALPLRLAPHLPSTLAHFEVDWAVRVPDRAHTLSLDILAQVGLPGLLLFTAFAASLVARLIAPRPGRGRHIAFIATFLLPFIGAGLAALAANRALLPLGYSGGLFAGVLIAIIAAPARPAARGPWTHPLAPFLLAALAGDWLLLGFSFGTHATLLLSATLIGLALALEANTRASEPASRGTALPLAGMSLAVFSFSLSAAGMAALPLWAAGGALVIALALALSQRDNDWLSFAAPVLALLPAVWLNRSLGWSAWLAYTWLLVWLVAQPFILARRIPRLAPLAGLLALIVLANLPVYGDIAFKSALFSAGDARDTLFERALRLSPHDHMLALGILPGEMQQLAPDATLSDPQAQRIVALFERSQRAQPAAVEPVALYAEWLRSRADATDLARRQYERALALSPNDIAARTGFALFKARSGDAAGAMADLTALLQLDPLYGPGYLHLARLQQEGGDMIAARATLERGIAHVPWWDALPAALNALSGP